VGELIFGETPNLAARLQGIAEPNSVVIAEATRRLLGNLLELRDLGAVTNRAARARGALEMTTAIIACEPALIQYWPVKVARPAVYELR
jgi:class 3 adenylate cyclase